MWIQVGIGILLLVASRGRLSQLAGVVSVGWGLVVWVFGEAFGGIFGSGLSWLFGAPGAVLLYVVAGVLIALPEGAWIGQRIGRALLGVLGVFFVGMAILQAWPGRGFWQGQSNPHATAGALTSMAQTMSQTPQPHPLSSLVSSFASFDAQHGWSVNLFIVLALAAIGIALLIGREQVTFVALVCSSVLCIAVWVFVQDLGFLGGVGTDPNSMVPTVLLIGAGYLALTRQAAPAVQRVEVAKPAGWRAALRSPAALGIIAAVASFGIVLVGAVPMAFASVNTHTDTIVTEAINGQPEPTDTPATPFELTDQNGAAVSLATLKGRTVALTFLDPVCTSDCPLIAQVFRQVDDSLGAAATKNTAFVAVVANPTYLDVQFVQAFDSQENMNMPNWYFLTGSLTQLTAVWNAYGIQVQTIGSGGMAAHSDTTYVIDGASHLRTILGADPGGHDDRRRIICRLAEQRNACGRGRMRSPKGTYTATVLAVGVLTITMGCSSHSGASSSRTAANPSIGVPLTTSVAASSGTWATFPMGHLDDPANTFWELFTLPSGGQLWAQHTPPDVADNGGLVIAPTSAGAVVGFRPSELLSFSPLASTEDGGTTYTPGLLSGGLANVPDALSVSPSGEAAALTATQVLTSAATLSGVAAGDNTCRHRCVASRPGVRRPTTDGGDDDRHRHRCRRFMLEAWRRRVAPARGISVRVGWRAVANRGRRRCRRRAAHRTVQARRRGSHRRPQRVRDELHRGLESHPRFANVDALGSGAGRRHTHLHGRDIGRWLRGAREGQLGSIDRGGRSRTRERLDSARHSPCRHGDHFGLEQPQRCPCRRL